MKKRCRYELQFPVKGERTLLPCVEVVRMGIYPTDVNLPQEVNITTAAKEWCS
jgi:hypothetical protein